MQNPSILIDVLTAKPEIIYEALARLTPWQNLPTKDDIRRIEDKMVTKDEAKNFATKDDLKVLEAKMVTKDEAKNFATKDDLNKAIRKIETTITALGARWGLLNENTFRIGINDILKDLGWKVSEEVLYDKTGYIYGEPSDVEIDVTVRDGQTIIIEITSAIKRGDLPIILRKREFYEKEKKIKVDRVIVITPFIHDKYPDRVKAMAKDMGIEILYPE